MGRFLSALIISLTCCLPASAQVNNAKYQGLFLVGEFGELCTMCEAVVLCEAADEQPAHAAVPAQGSYTLYYIQTRTFWSQVSTIWEWFIANFDSASLAQGHTRPVWVYKVTADEWSGPELQEAHMALEPAVISFDNELIDRSKRSWLHKDYAEPLGYCQRMPLWDALEVINHIAPGEPAQ